MSLRIEYKYRPGQALYAQTVQAFGEVFTISTSPFLYSVLRRIVLYQEALAVFRRGHAFVLGK